MTRSVRGERPPAPTPLSDSVTAQMKRMPRSDTKPELALRRALHGRGLRFTVNRRDLPGTPDIVFSRAKLAIFVDGCFWHACTEHGVLPKNNREWWRAKLEATRRRDGLKDEALLALGWQPMHLWEHEPVSEMASRVVQAYRRQIAGMEGRRS